MIIYPSCLIFGESNDPHIISVISRMSPSSLPLIIDFKKFGVNFFATLFQDKETDVILTSIEGTRYSLNRVKAIWWRRPQPFSVVEEFEDRLTDYILEETRGLWRGILESLNHVVWYNHFDAHRQIDRKARQLMLAKQCGLSIPKTCITSNANDAEEFINSINGKVIFKSFSGSDLFWQPTRQYKKEYNKLLPLLSKCPVIFQEYISGEFEYRITVVDERIFVAKKSLIKSKYQYDVRMDLGIKYEKGNIPDETAQKIQHFMKVANIRYGAFDIRENENGDLFFLEVNPSGQFLYIEKMTGMDISSTIAEALSTGAERNHVVNIPMKKVPTSKKLFADLIEDKVSHISPEIEKTA